MKILFLFFLCFFTVISLRPFNFGYQEFPYCCKFEFLQLIKGGVFLGQDEPRLQNISKDFLWHVTIPTVGLLPEKKTIQDSYSLKEIFLWDLAQKRGSGIKIAILDFEVDKLNDGRDELGGNKFWESAVGCHTNNFRPGEMILNFKTSGHISRDRLTRLMKKNISGTLMQQKNHGAITLEIIKQLAPLATIILIPILDKQGFSSKKSLHQGLQKALELQVDIVHLGLKITTSMSKYNHEDLELASILKKFPYVVAAAGNDGAYIKQLAYPACLPELFFSVGAFECKNHKYQVCRFSQSSSRIIPTQMLSAQVASAAKTIPNFLLPGARILCPTWNKNIEDYVLVHTSGTSMSAAMMTGFLALLLAEFKNDFSKNEIIDVIIHCSKMLEKQWERRVNFGTIDMREALSTLLILQVIKRKIPLFQYKKNFLKIVQMIQKNFIKGSQNVGFFNFIRNEEGYDKESVKKPYVYAKELFHKKIDRDLYLLVQDSIYALKEGIWEKKHI